MIEPVFKKRPEITHTTPAKLAVIIGGAVPVGNARKVKAMKKNINFSGLNQAGICFVFSTFDFRKYGRRQIDKNRQDQS